MSRIIISYRRADSAAISGRIFDRLASHYGDEAVFMDVDKIPFGTDFREHIREVLLAGDILLAIIGPSWLGKSADGTSRIRDDADPVRVEIETALRQKTRIIPVLVDGASMPSVADLPDALRDLAYLNAAPIDVGRDFRTHMERLIRSIDEMLGRARPARTQVGARRSPARFALVTVLSTIALVLIGVTGFTLLSPKPESAKQPESTASLPAPPAPRKVASPASPLPAPNAAAALPGSAPEPATYRVLANVSRGVQNLRRGPGVQHPVVVEIPAGSTGITLGACHPSTVFGTRPWCAAKWRTYEGFISSCCIVDEKTGAPPRVE
jgi:TIR domain